MDEVIIHMLKKYECKTKTDFSNALKEIIQEIALLGLWRSKFFEYAAFYGGTSLRILYGLNRFSEDMDFSLLKRNLNFDLSPHIVAIEEELKSFGFDVTVDQKDKKNETQIERAFVKGDTKIHLLKAEVPEAIVNQTQGNEVIKVKFEVDIDPPLNFDTEMKDLLMPIPFQVKTMTPESLFAGKLHAVLARKWKTRVKGRDYFDLLWHISRNTQPNLVHLKSRLVQSADWPAEKDFSQSDFKALLLNKIESVNFEDAKNDIAPFLKERERASLSLWSTKYFLKICEQL